MTRTIRKKYDMDRGNDNEDNDNEDNDNKLKDKVTEKLKFPLAMRIHQRPNPLAS